MLLLTPQLSQIRHRMSVVLQRVQSDFRTDILLDPDSPGEGPIPVSLISPPLTTRTDVPAVHILG